MKYLCFRFDVDTHKCLRDGVPNLLALADELKVKFTFFINFGRAVSRRHSLQSNIWKNKTTAKFLPARIKLGIKDYLYTALLNPSIGKKYAYHIQRISDSGHEVGLHGGKNHEAWAKDAKNWSEEKIRAEIFWGKYMMKAATNHDAIDGFASPNWNGPEKMYNLLHPLGFKYIADIHSDEPMEKITLKNGIKTVPTNIVGEPGGVGYIEYCRATQMTDAEIIGDFKKKLSERKKIATIYDHPYYAGTKEIDLIRDMIKLAKDMKYTIVTMKEIARSI